MFVLIHYNYQPLTYLTYEYFFFMFIDPLYYSLICVVIRKRINETLCARASSHS